VVVLANIYWWVEKPVMALTARGGAFAWAFQESINTVIHRLMVDLLAFGKQ
jgi:hypothetical protein